MSGNWCNVRRPMEVAPGEMAAYVRCVQPPSVDIGPYPDGLTYQTATTMNLHGIEYHELEAWVRLKAGKQYSAKEAAEIIIRSRRGGGQ